MTVNVIDTEGKAFTQDIGNGSVCTLKLFGYRNPEGQLTVTLDTVQVIEHIPYEGKTSADSVDDDVLGVSYKVKKAEAKQEEAQADKPAPKAAPETEAEDDELNDVPF